MVSTPADSNGLISTRPPDNPLAIQLHPLVLLAISDYITRYTLRGLKGPLFGAVIGQQNGRSYTLEHAYECTVKQADEGGDTLFDADFFTQRLEQYKAVHKAPAMDLVAIFTLAPQEGPQAAHIPALLQAQKLAALDGVLLLLFHPSAVKTLEGGKLPISVYESYQEQDGQTLFWERQFEVETGEAEMIGINYVAKGSGSTQAAVPNTSTSGDASSSDRKVKGKGKANEDGEPDELAGIDSNVLSAQDDELLAALTAKVNAIKMLKQRLELIQAYLKSLPTSTLTDAASSESPSTANLVLLRNINAMISRLPLLAPNTKHTESYTDVPSLAEASAKEREDVQLTSLLASLTRSIAEAQSLGLRFSEVQRERLSKGNEMRMAPMLNEGMMDTVGP